MFFVGALDYEPNTEAVEWFVREVLPRVRAQVPDACVRIVGRGAERVAWAAEVPGVQLVGAVPELAAELDRADVSIVPIRVGAGTRLKVVEALANRLPLVTTTVGCEGIDVRNGHDALIADDAASFAGACVRLLSDGALRQRLADAGAELFARRYDWDGIEATVAELARSTVRAAQERSRSTAGE
jgi:glycosyltransferase involved in cell wall biosynthesis